MGPGIGDVQQKAQELAERLLGTTDPLPDWVLETDDPDLCVLLDEAVMLCETCGWWVETHEMDDEQNCEQCQNE